MPSPTISDHCIKRTSISAPLSMILKSDGSDADEEHVNFDGMRTFRKRKPLSNQQLFLSISFFSRYFLQP